MANSKCNRGSGDGGGARDLRFSYVFCNCKKVALLRIVTNQAKPTRGSFTLYVRAKNVVSSSGASQFMNSKSVLQTSVGGSDFEDFALNLSKIRDKIEKLVNVVSHCLSFVVVVTIVCVFK